ncbi:MAG: membrane protein insertase YidC [Deltaproteobacteria bacterium]|nr:membrane protein insertase YidC [Deltaproteobacteria bacterium]
MDKKTFLAIVLSLMVVFTWQAFFAKQPPPKQPDSVQQGGTVEGKPASKEAAPEQAKPVYTRTILSKPAAVIEKDIKVETPLYTAVFTTRGGTLKSYKLNNYRTNLASDSELIELVNVNNGMLRPLTVTFPGSTIDIPPESIYMTDSNAINITQSPDNRRLTFTQIYPKEVKIEKIFTFYPEKYTFELEVKVHNLSNAPLNQSALLSWHQYMDPKAETDSYGHDGPISFIAKSIDLYEAKKIESGKLLGPDVAWAGFESKYFLASMIAQNPTLTTLSLSVDAQNMVSVNLKDPQNIIPPGQIGLFTYTLYLGPKDYDILKAQGVGLENAIDFGSWMKWLAMPLLISLKFLNNHVANYGTAIIILTLLIKILFWPLGNKSYKSMKEMQKLQPKIAELREKFKTDKTKLSQETMALYKTHKVNPLGGCLPMVIQIPVFFGLYKALMYSIELRHAPFYWWIQDLSAKDPYYITPIIMGATMFIQQKMSPPVGDPMQAKLMLLMPVVFTFLFLSFPSGLVLYWLFQNILSIGQQLYINKKPS